MANAVTVLQPYYDGTDDNGGAPGVNGNNYLALVWLKPLNGKQIGDVTGSTSQPNGSATGATPTALQLLPLGLACPLPLRRHSSHNLGECGNAGHTLRYRYPHQADLLDVVVGTTITVLASSACTAM